MRSLRIFLMTWAVALVIYRMIEQHLISRSIKRIEAEGGQVVKEMWRFPATSLLIKFNDDPDSNFCGTSLGRITAYRRAAEAASSEDFRAEVRANTWIYREELKRQRESETKET